MSPRVGLLAAAALVLPLGVARAALTVSSAACPGTLQACIDAAPPGETIEIATATPFDENLLVAKSLTLRSAPGFVARIEGIGTDRTRRGLP